MSAKKIIAGVIAGAVLGILLAPDKGSKTRKKIVKTKDEFKQKIKDWVEEFVDTITTEYENVRERASEFPNNKRDAVKA